MPELPDAFTWGVSTSAYQMGSAEYLKLKQDIARYVGAPVASFQGAYRGKEFSVY